MLSNRILLLLALFCAGCGSQVKKSEPLPDTFSVKVFDKKTKTYKDQIASVERLEKADGSQHIKVSAKSAYQSFSANIADEYIYYINRFLKIKELDDGEEEYLGDSHTFSDLARIKFSAVSHDGNGYLRAELCSFGHCNGYGAMLYDEAEALKLRAYVLEFQSEFGKKPKIFEPSAPAGGKSRVYMYRLNSAPLAVKVPININGAEKFKLAVNQCFWFDVAPGEYAISTSKVLMTASAAEKFVFNANETYFVKYTSMLYDQKRKPDYTLNSMMKIFYDRNMLKIEPLVVAQHDISACEQIDIDI